MIANATKDASRNARKHGSSGNLKKLQWVSFKLPAPNSNEDFPTEELTIHKDKENKQA